MSAEHEGHSGHGGYAGAQVEFHTEFPSQGRYRMFLQFVHAGVVRTAAFTVEIRP